MKSKTWKYLTPIISGAIGIVIGGLVDWKKQDSLAAKEFEYRLIESTLSRDLSNAQKNLDFLLDVGLINNIDTAALRLRILNEDLPAVGYWDGFTMSNLTSLLRAFYSKKGRFPNDITEFRRTYPIELHLRILGLQNLKYEPVGQDQKDCKFSFAGPDNRWDTDDDRVILAKDILGQ